MNANRVLLTYFYKVNVDRYENFEVGAAGMQL